jgi:uncharacterized protein
MLKYIDRLNNIFTTANVCKSHGIDHAIAVMAHADLAIKSKNYKISKSLKEAVKLAALLHDADDRKFFPTHQNYENLKRVLHDKPITFVDKVVRMVSLVSSSSNADRIPEDVINNEWMLIPRYADRVEAIGIIGVERCLQYNKTKGRPIYIESTPRAYSEEEIFQIATEERYNSYVGKSNSMIDHYYDKLLRISKIPINNDYLVQLAQERQQVTIRFVLYFSVLEDMTNKDVELFIEREKNKYTMIT